MTDLLSVLRSTKATVKILGDKDIVTRKVSPALAMILARNDSYDWGGSTKRVRWMRRVLDKREIEDPHFSDPNRGFWSGRSAIRHFGEPLPNAGRSV